MGLYLAIDNGGTKTDYVLADETRELARARSGTIKRMRVDAATASANLEEGLAELVRVSGASMAEVTRTCVGTAGQTVPMVTDWLRAELGQRVAGELGVLGDVEIALDAAFHGGPGVLVLAGTGSNVAGRGSDGALTNAGGWGPALGEQGSGYKIGVEALRAVFLAMDEGRETTLLKAVLGFWGLESLEALVAYANRLPSPDVSRLTEVVVGCAAGGDRVAQEVLQREGESLGYLVRLVLRRLIKQERELPAVAFAGSIMEKVMPVRNALIASVRGEFPALRTLEGVVDPLSGALWRARMDSK